MFSLPLASLCWNFACWIERKLLFVECSFHTFLFINSNLFSFFNIFFSFTIPLQSQICTWLSADWGGCTTTCPFYTSWCAAWREVFTSHAWRSWTNYFPSTSTVSLKAGDEKFLLRRRWIMFRCSLLIAHKWKIIPIFTFLNFDFLITRLPFGSIHLPYLLQHQLRQVLWCNARSSGGGEKEELCNCRRFWHEKFHSISRLVDCEIAFQMKWLFTLVDI